MLPRSIHLRKVLAAIRYSFCVLGARSCAERHRSKLSGGDIAQHFPAAFGQQLFEPLFNIIDVRNRTNKAVDSQPSHLAESQKNQSGESELACETDGGDEPNPKMKIPPIPWIVVGFFLTQISCSLAQSAHSLSPKDLPFLPLKKEQVIAAEGMDFGVLHWDPNTLFDAAKGMPTLSGTSPSNNTVGWVTTPADYVVTDDIILSVRGKKEDDFHHLELIQYKKKVDWVGSNFCTIVGVLCWDTKPFCIYARSDPDDDTEFSADSSLQYINGKLRLDVGQYESGTGADNSHAIFSLSASGGPQLIEFRYGGRGR